MDVLAGIAYSCITDALSYVLVALGVFLTLRVLIFPDLTVDGSFVTGGSVAALLISNQCDPYLATFLAMLSGFGCGALTGILNTKLRITALLSGILMMVALYSINLMIMGRPNIPLLRDVTVFESVALLFGTFKSPLLVAGVLAVITGAVMLALRWFLRTDLGLALRATGDNEHLMRGLGSDTDWNIILGTSIANGMVALSGALVAQRQGFCDVNMGIGVIVLGLACVILGEGIFNPRSVGAMLAAVFVGTIIYRLFLIVALRLGLAPGNFKLITALLVIIALTVPFLKKSIKGEYIPPAARF